MGIKVINIINIQSYKIIFISKNQDNIFGNKLVLNSL